MKKQTAGRIFSLLAVLSGVVFAYDVDPAAYDPQPHWLRSGHPMMWSILTGTKPIVFEPEADKDAEYVVVFGLSEAHHQHAGDRVMMAKVEGAEDVVVDVLEKVERGVPYALAITGKDANKDGILDISLNPMDVSKVENCAMNGLWVFSKSVWDEQGIEAGKLALSDEFDGNAFYLVNCGLNRYTSVKLSQDEVMASTARRIASLNELIDSNSVVKTYVAGKLGLFNGIVASAQKNLDAGRLADYEQDLRRLTKELEAINAPLLNDLHYVLEPTPALKRPTLTRMGNPWMGKLTIEQGDTIKLNLQNHPVPTSQVAKYHNQWTHPKIDVLGAVEVSTTSKLQQLSEALSLGYNLGMTSVDYDPLVTSLRSLEGAVTVRSLFAPAYMVQGDRLGLTVRFDKERFQETAGLWYAKGNVKGLEIYCGLIFDQDAVEKDGAVSCERFALVWGDDLESLKAVASEVSNWGSMIAKTDRWIREETAKIDLTGSPSMIEQVETGKRVLLSMGFVSGGMYAALDEYEHVWVRDTANAVVFPALAGDPELLKRWTPYALANPAKITYNDKPYEGFFTWITTDNEQQGLEGDGAFYAAFSAYAHWKLTGEVGQLPAWYQTLANACAFMEENCFDEEYGLYEEWYINEASLKKSPIWEGQYPGLKINDLWPEYICSIYLNSLMYSTHIMMAEMAKEIGNPSEYERHLKAGNDLANSIDKHLWNEETGYYHTGIARLEDQSTEMVTTEYWTIWFDNVWGFGLFPMAPDTQKRLASLDAVLTKRDGIFPGYDKRFFFTPMRAHAAYTYNAEGQSEKAMTCIQRLFERAEDVDASEGVKKIYAMKGAMPEMMHMVTEHRPQTFTIGPYITAAAGLGFVMDYNGLTAAPSEFLTEARNIAFRDSVWNFDLIRADEPDGIIVDGKKLKHTMKIPMGMMTVGEHNVSVLDTPVIVSPVLRYTPYELLDVQVELDKVIYKLRGLGGSVLRFDEGVAEADVNVSDAKGKPMEFVFWQAEGGSRVQVNVAGEFSVEVKR